MLLAEPNSPWIRVHADFAGPMNGRFYLILVDAYSKWPEIVQMSSISSTATIQKMKDFFARFGSPTTLVTDNGTQFTCSQFALFCRSRGINHIRIPPFHPQSNEQAERFVDTFKRGLAKLKGEEPTLIPVGDSYSDGSHVWKCSPKGTQGLLVELTSEYSENAPCGNHKR
ncbi:integrase core domain protein, partial [Teladorsagia circumcincta]